MQKFIAVVALGSLVLAPGLVIAGGPDKGSNSTQNTNVNVNANSNRPRQAPLAYAPVLAVASDTCMGAISVGASTPFGGISGGVTRVDEDCTRRAYARSLQALGLEEAALAVLANNPEVAAALVKTGYKAAWLSDGKDRVMEARLVAPAPLTNTVNFASDRSP